MEASDATLRFLGERNLDLETRHGDRARAIRWAIRLKLSESSNSASEETLDSPPVPATWDIVVEDLLNLYPHDCLCARDQTGYMLLHNAAQTGHSDLVQMFLGKGAEVDARTKENRTALMLAAKAGHSDIVDMLMERGACIHAQVPIEHSTTPGYTALHFAAGTRSPDTTQRLLRHGADAGVAARAGDTPLHCAVRAHSISNAALLLFHGAPLTATNKESFTPQSLVEEQQCTYNLKRKFRSLFAYTTIKGNHASLVEKLRARTLSLNTTKAIHWAVDKNLDRAAEYILFADKHVVRAGDARDWNPLQAAAGTKCVKVVLVKDRAVANCLTQTGWTPLMLPTKQGPGAAIRMFVEPGAKRAAEKDGGKITL